MIPDLALVWRQYDYWRTVLARTWRGGVISSLVLPLFYVVSMGVLLGRYVSGGAQLDGAASYLAFIAPGLVATQSMNIAFGEAAWPVMGMITWDKVYDAMVATPLRTVDILGGHVGFIAFRIASALAVFMAVLAIFGLSPSPVGWLLALGVQVLVGLAFATLIMGYTLGLRSDTGLSILYRLGMVPLFLFSGAFFPISALAPPLQAAAQLTPLYHGVELTRMLYLDQVDWRHAVGHTGYLLALAIAGWWLAARRLERRLVA